MTRFDDFFETAPGEAKNLELIYGTYGCQQCEEYSEKAYFNESTGEISWYCPKKHKSGIVVG